MNFALEKAKKELYEFLEQNPELIEYQNALSAAMDKAGDDPAKRFIVFNEFLQYNLSDLKFEMIQLKEKIDNVKDNKS